MLEISGIFYNNSVFKTGSQGFHLLLAGGSNLRVVNNTLVMAFTAGNEYGGIEVETNSNVTIADNHINISGRGSGETGPLSAVFVDRGREITIANNTFILNSTGNASAISFEGGNNSIVTNNSMTVTSTGSITYGVFLTLRPTTFISQNNTFANNTITVNGTSRTK